MSYERARPLLLSWAESLGDTLDVCPLPTPESWVYFAAVTGRYIKVGWTRRPEKRPFECWRSFHSLPRETEPVLVIGDAGRNVERLVKRAARGWCLRRGRLGGLKFFEEEIFHYDSPVLTLVGELRCVATASFFRNQLAALPPGVPRKRCTRCNSLGHNASTCARHAQKKAA